MYQLLIKAICIYLSITMNKYVPNAHTSESMGLKTGSCLNTYFRTNRHRLSENTVDIATVNIGT